MIAYFIICCSAVLTASAEKHAPPAASHYQLTTPAYQTSAHHGYQSQYHQPQYHQPQYHQPQYHQPQYHQPQYHQPERYEYCPEEPVAPECSSNTTDPWCLEDSAYPEYEIKHALHYHKEKFAQLYGDVALLTTNVSVDRLSEIEEETYLCSTEVGYVRPLRAVNTDSKWRVIVNNIKVDYETYTQTARIEKCLSAGEPCPLVPHCYETSCLQKSAYIRFLVYDPCDQYFPFAVESFQLPSSCACHMSQYVLSH